MTTTAPDLYAIGLHAWTKAQAAASRRQWLISGADAGGRGFVDRRA